MAIDPEKPLLGDRTTATIMAPDGSVANKPTMLLTLEEAKLLRAYKKFLLKRRLQEVTRCLDCFEQNRPDFHRKSFVTDTQILFECSCRALFYQGQTI